MVQMATTAATTCITAALCIAIAFECWASWGLSKVRREARRIADKVSSGKRIGAPSGQQAHSDAVRAYGPLTWLQSIGEYSRSAAKLVFDDGPIVAEMLRDAGKGGGFKLLAIGGVIGAVKSVTRDTSTGRATVHLMALDTTMSILPIEPMNVSFDLSTLANAPNAASAPNGPCIALVLIF